MSHPVTADAFVYSTYIFTTPQQVWRALTSGEATKQYFFGRRIESTWKVGAPITFWTAEGEKDVYGEVLECEPARRLSYTFKHPDDTNQRKRPTRATFEIRQLGPIVKLTLIHRDLIPEDFESNPDVFQGLNNGWPAILSNLKTYLETGKAFAFPGTHGTK